MINFRRSSQKDTNFTSRVRETIESSIEALRGISKDQQPASGRISLWNRLFPDFDIPVTTDVGQHLVDIFRRHLLRCTTAQRFCFELAVMFVDLPGEFLRVVNFLPFSYSVALKIAFRAIHEHLEFSQRGSVRELVAKLVRELQPMRLSQFTASVHAIQHDPANADRAVNKLSQILSTENFDLLLGVMPAHLHLRWALRHGRPLPRFQMDFQSIELPFEFLQAIADIEGEETADAMIVYCDQPPLGDCWSTSGTNPLSGSPTSSPPP
jgi:hypothetical protein